MATRHRAPWILPFLIIWAVVLVGFVGLVVSLHRIEVRNAQRFCESLIPQLEAGKAQQGRYPESLNPDWWKGRELPKVLKGRKFYWGIGEGQTYAFGTEAASFFYDRAQYVPEFKIWSEYDINR